MHAPTRLVKCKWKPIPVPPCSSKSQQSVRYAGLHLHLLQRLGSSVRHVVTPPTPWPVSALLPTNASDILNAQVQYSMCVNAYVHAWLYGHIDVIVTPGDAYYLPVWACGLANWEAVSVERSGPSSGRSPAFCFFLYSLDFPKYSSKSESYYFLPCSNGCRWISKRDFKAIIWMCKCGLTYCNSSSYRQFEGIGCIRDSLLIC